MSNISNNVIKKYFLPTGKNHFDIRLAYFLPLSNNLNENDNFWFSEYKEDYPNFTEVVSKSFYIQPIYPEDIKNGVLEKSKFDCVVFPGGSARNHARCLGEEGKNMIRNYVKNGGNFFGICAGCYSVCSEIKLKKRFWKLNLLNIDVIDIEHWKRGKSKNCEIELTKFGKKIMFKNLKANCESKFKVKYENGPLVKIFDEEEFKSHHQTTVLAKFVSEYNENGAEKVMKNSPAILFGKYFKGNVVVTSPHLEYKKNNKIIFEMLNNLIRFCCFGNDF